MNYIEVIEVIVRIVAIAVAGLLIPYLRSKISASTEQKIIVAVSLAVKAAEQLFPEQGSGEQKRQWVIKYITEKFNLSEEEIIRIMEAFVYELNN